MSSSFVRHFTDPDHYMSSLRWTKAEIVVTQAGNFESTLTQIVLPTVTLNRYADNLARVLRAYLPANRATFVFSDALAPNWFAGTVEMPANALIRLSQADTCFQRSVGFAQFAAVSLSVGDLETLGVTTGRSVFKPPQQPSVVALDVVAIDRLLKIHAAIGKLAAVAPEVIAVPEAARSLDQALLSALADCLAPLDVEGRAISGRHHAGVMKRFYAMLEAHPDGVIHTLEMCKAIGVSNRTLTTCCNETLGMSPYRFFRLRQLNLAHRALTRANPRADSVTDIATAHGFWELGRFARAYRALFGELPSATLQREPDASPLLPAGMIP